MTRRDRLRVVGWWGLAIAITGLAFALRVHALGVPNLTNDEWFMLRNHDEGPLWIIHQAHTFEPHPLLYYLGLAGWIELAGRSEFAMRFPSVVFGTLLVSGLIGIGRSLVGPRAGLIAGLLVALNPYQIVESQNARNYAMVVSLSALASLLFIQALKHGRRRDWLAYGAAMLLALNTHLDAALVLMVHVAYVAALGLVGAHDGPLQKIRKGSLAGASFASRQVRLWARTTIVISLVFGAWVLYAWPALLAYHGYFPASVTLERVLARSLATFSLGQTSSIHQALPAFGLAVIGFGWLALKKPRAATFLGLYTLLPILMVSLIFLVRPMFDERYLIVLAPGFLAILAAALDGLLTMSLPVGALVAAATLYVLVPTLPATYRSMLTDRSDFRSMASWVSTFGNSDDPIVATGFGQAELFSYYYHGPRKVQVIDQPRSLIAQLPTVLQGHDGVWLLPYWHNPADEAAVDTLDQLAAPAAERWFVNVRALYFASAGRFSQPSPAQASWNDQIALGHVALTSGEVEPGEAAAATLQWTVRSPLPTPKLSLRLLDATGATITQSDQPLAADANLAPGDRLTRIGLLVPAVVSPGPYTLAVVLYQAASGTPLRLATAGPTRDGALVLGSIQVGVRRGPVPLAEAGLDVTKVARFPSGVSLVGYDSWGPARPAGDWLSFQILWRADRAGLPNVERTLSLRDSSDHDVTLQSGPILPAYPTSRWSPGQMLAERVHAQIPPTLTSGYYQLRLSIGGDSSPPVILGDVVVSGPNRSFVKPSVAQPIDAQFGTFSTLLGVRPPPSRARPGAALDITLVWQARGTADRSYSAFVHLLDPSGKIRGQIDRIPVDGTRPTDGWVTGEYLMDEYRPTLASDAPAGTYRIEVGLYDSRSGARLPVTLADGTQADHVVVGTFDVAP